MKYETSYIASNSLHFRIYRFIDSPVCLYSMFVLVKGYCGTKQHEFKGRIHSGQQN